MKPFMLLALVALTFASCQQKTADHTAATETTAQAGDIVPADGPALTFDQVNYDFGKIAQGEKVYYSYKFKNTGKSPLIIKNAEASCGCTVPEIPKEPIKPGAEGEIKVVFNSQGKRGVQDKVISVVSNAIPGITALHLTGEIKE